MYVLVQYDCGVSTADRSMSLVGTYETLAAAQSKMRELCDNAMFKDAGCYVCEMHASVYDSNDNPEWDWFIFDTDSPNSFVNW